MKSGRLVGSVLVAAAAAAITLAVTADRGSAAAAQAKPDAAGFVSLFDGKTLNGWRGDPRYWSVQDGALTGGSEQPIEKNNWLISDKSYANFELRFKYRFKTQSGNSGMHIRSGVTSEKDYYLTGYQANVVPTTVSAERVGMLYEEIGRKELVMLGERAVITRQRADQAGNYEIIRTVVGYTNPKEVIIRSIRPYPEWNEYTVIAYGNHIVEAINGLLAFDATDNDPVGAKEGVLGMQVHFGNPSIVQYKDIEIKVLAAPPSLNGRFATQPTTLEKPLRTAVKSETTTRSLD